jgi:hypothetical protein
MFHCQFCSESISFTDSSTSWYWNARWKVTEDNRRVSSASWFPFMATSVKVIHPTLCVVLYVLLEKEQVSLLHHPFPKHFQFLSPPRLLLNINNERTTLLELKITSWRESHSLSTNSTSLNSSHFVFSSFYCNKKLFRSVEQSPPSDQESEIFSLNACCFIETRCSYIVSETLWERLCQRSISGVKRSLCLKREGEKEIIQKFMA